MVNVQIITDCSVLDRFCFWCIVCLFWWNYRFYRWYRPWKSCNTVSTMQKQKINGFATVLRVVICFIILTDLTEFSVEVLCGWSVRWSRRSRCEKKEERQELKLGDSRGTPSKYSRRLKRLSLGMLGRHPLFLQQVSICFRISFVHAICASLGASLAFSFNFSFMHHAGMR